MCWNVGTLDSSASPKKRWILTEAAFNKLLDSLDGDRQRAGEKYRQLHHKLEKFFEIHRSAAAEELADEAINRVARKLEEGLRIQNIGNYCVGVARLVLKENFKQQSRKTELGDMPSVVATDSKSAPESEIQFQCFDFCLDKLPVEARTLIMEYYELRKQAKIDRRKALADELGIPVNALRIRVHRIRSQLEECVIRCVASTTKK
jgi:DNA-directed RNA polymerase specialized sigma24 family protein